MRWLGWVIVTALGGCTGLNGAFEESQGSRDTGGNVGGEASSAATSNAGASSTAGSASAASSVGETGSSGVSTTPPPTSSGQPGSTTGLGTSGTLTSAGSTVGTKETGRLDDATGGDDRVVFLYAVDDWMAPGNYPPASSPQSHCTENAPPAASLCGSPPVALLRQPGLTVPAILGDLDPGWAELPVFGLAANGSIPIAETPLGLLGELETSLAAGGVEDPSGTGMFFSGGPADMPDTCEGWSDPFSTAITGSFNDSSDAWFSSSMAECDEHLPILCVCLSVEGPFE